VRLLKLQSWATAVREHEPGKFDAPASRMNDWAPSELRTALEDVRTMMRFLAAARETLQTAAASSGAIPFDFAITLWEDEEVLGLTDDEVVRGDQNDILKRGALLHADIAILAPFSTRFGIQPSPLSANDVVYLYSDGRLQGVGFAGVHWTIARGLLDEVRPDPSLDEIVALWYRATGAYLQTHQAFAYAVPHLDDARRIFPGDADIWLYSGSVHEGYAAPHVQASVGPGAGSAAVGSIRSSREEFRQAERAFRQALKSDPKLTEARIRLGHVLELSGHAQEAVTELRRAAAETDSNLLRYYADLFLGQAEEALGRREAAREAFDRAAERYPRAQSPRLALSQLARRYGDRAGALGAIQQVLALTGDETRREDPWWYYYRIHVPDADTLLDQMRTRFQAERPQ